MIYYVNIRSPYFSTIQELTKKIPRLPSVSTIVYTKRKISLAPQFLQVGQLQAEDKRHCCKLDLFFRH